MWEHDWEHAERQRVELGYKKMQNRQGSVQASLEAEVRQLRKELEYAQRVISGGVSEKAAMAAEMAEQLEREREKRV